MSHMDPDFGAIAQLGERLPCTQEVGGSIPPGSTNKKKGCKCILFFVRSKPLAAKDQKMVMLFAFLNDKKATE